METETVVPCTCGRGAAVEISLSGVVTDYIACDSCQSEADVVRSGRNAMQYPIKMWLARSDDTRDVFCEMNYARTRQCAKHVTFDEQNSLIRGLALAVDGDATRYFCSVSCLTRWVRANGGK